MTDQIPNCPTAQQWIKCSERMPNVNEDFDWEGNIWVCSPLGAVFSVCGISDLTDEWHWMPTGLKIPQPPEVE
ncbi:MAG: DUF551 domain-containing protein [Gammaproteobacteria bacterium]|nr:DUF551 domain-containing protein [Gammaproteobacteria bacterium]MCP5013876.1 DUF551 domain-containing protein [Ketobacter sp.]